MKGEIKHYLKKYWFFIFLQALLITLLLGLITVFVQFTTLTSGQLHHFEDSFHGKTMFTVGVDVLAETNTTLYIDEENRIHWDETVDHSISLFYDLLNQRSDIHFLSMNSQSTSIRDFHGGDLFDAFYGTELMGEYELNDNTYLRVKAIQMNQQAFEFFDLELANGVMFSWEEIDYNERTIPILLGDAYQDIYEIGDVLISGAPFENFELEVYGFLPPNTSIFYFYEPNYVLDRYMVMPYPYSLQAYVPIDHQLKVFLSLAMISGDIVVADDEGALAFVLNVLSIVGELSGFEDYLLWDVNLFATHFTRMVAILNYNVQLLQAVLVFCMAILFFISTQVSKHLFKRRKKHYQLFHTLGFSQKFMCKLILREIRCMFIMVSIFLLVVMYLVLIGLYPHDIFDPAHLFIFPLFLVLEMNRELLVAAGIQCGLAILTYLCLKSELKKILN
ncbi:MAG: hypothetical protein FWG67_00815 [Defluviitaleaceae bacterium]|nr:hypothetical protein [Defluviitaleaceae bacterium]